ncbi:hypothetical protein [Streptomyces chrestomyceticus]|uniref:hypothetical protein n=1 Tax=Streptomyces chrestomyceticus TaxID=68185 RepID=UPI0033F5230C
MRIFTRLSAIMSWRKKSNRQENAAPVDPLRLAVDNLAELLNPVCADEVGGYFRCDEADAIADVLIQAGRVEAAETWLAGHAEHDRYGDLHYQGTDRSDGDPDNLAPVAVDIREYVAALAA